MVAFGMVMTAEILVQMQMQSIGMQNESAI